jgi:hypothetical protein
LTDTVIGSILDPRIQTLEIKFWSLFFMYLSNAGINAFSGRYQICMFHIMRCHCNIQIITGVPEYREQCKTRAVGENWLRYVVAMATIEILKIV